MSELRVIRVAEGHSLPDGWEFKQWLGTENNIIYGPPNYRADVILAVRVAADEDIVWALCRRLLKNEEVYVSTGYLDGDKRRFCVDGTIFDITQDEIDALNRWFGKVENE